MKVNQRGLKNWLRFFWKNYRLPNMFIAPREFWRNSPKQCLKYFLWYTLLLYGLWSFEKNVDTKNLKNLTCWEKQRPDLDSAQKSTLKMIYLIPWIHRSYFVDQCNLDGKEYPNFHKISLSSIIFLKQRNGKNRLVIKIRNMLYFSARIKKILNFSFETIKKTL